MKKHKGVLIKPHNYLILCLLFVVGCEQQHIEYDADGNQYEEKYYAWSGLTELIKYNSSGRVLARGFLKNGKREGEVINYHENGQLRSIANYSDDVLEGAFKTFYPSGQLKKEIHFIKGIPIGWSYEYWENGNKKKATEFLYIGTDSRSNQYIRYNKAGIAIRDSSHYMSVSSSRDTVNLGEAISFHFKLEAPFYKDDGEMRVLVGGFDSKFGFVDSTRTDTVAGKGLVAVYTIKPANKGKQFIRGRLDDFKTVQLNHEEYVYMEEEVNIHFKKEFYVK